MEQKTPHQQKYNPTTSFVNCTPHEIVVKTVKGEIDTYAVSGIIPRVDRKLSDVFTMNDVAVRNYYVGDDEIVGLPEESAFPPETVFIVSAMVAEALAKRGTSYRYVSPGPALRGPNGVIVACDGFIHHAYEEDGDLAKLHAEIAALDINQEVK